MHVGRRCPPNHQFAIQPHVEAVVARAVQFDVARFGRVPVAGPARAKESSGQVGVVVQEVEGDRGADVVEERCAVEADIGEYLPADAGPVRRAGTEEKQECGEPGGHADGAPSQAAKPLPVEPGKTKSYGHGSTEVGSLAGKGSLRKDIPLSAAGGDGVAEALTADLHRAARLARSSRAPRSGTEKANPERLLESLPISAPMVNDSLAQIAPSATAIGPPSPTARRLVAASVSANTHRAYAGALGQLDAWLAGQKLDDATLAAYLAELHDARRAASSGAMAVAAARFRARLTGQADPAGERTARLLAGYRRTAGDRGRGQARPFSAADLAAVLATCHLPRRRGRGVESDQVAAARGRTDAVIAGLLFMGGMPRSEVAALRWADVADTGDADGILLSHAARDAIRTSHGPGSCAQFDVAARRVHISGRTARDQQLAVDQDVETIVTGAVQGETAGLGQVPEAVPPGTEEPPRQLRVSLQKVKRYVRCDPIDERFSGKF